MSSHHFVKEDQEPAVIFLDDVALQYQHTMDLLEWSPKVLAWEGVLAKLISLQVNVDQVYVVNPSDWNTELLDQQPVEIVVCKGPAYLISSALSLEINKDMMAVYVVTKEEDVLGHVKEVIVNNLCFERVFIFFDGYRKYTLVTNGLYEKWIRGDEELLVYTIDDPITISSVGFLNDLLAHCETGVVELKASEDGLVKIREKDGNKFIVCQVI